MNTQPIAGGGKPRPDETRTDRIDGTDRTDQVM